MAYKKPPKSPSEPPKTSRAPSKSQSTMQRSRSIAKKRTEPSVPKPYLALAPAKSSSKKAKPLPKGTVRSPKLSRAKGAKRTAAYKATKGTSSKRAVKRTTAKVLNRSLKTKGIASVTGARKKARQMVRARKVRK